MPYSKYTHDIFLSYRHLDNKSLDKEEIGWITRLHQDLAARVAQWLGNDIGIWRDQRLQGNEDFSASILQSVVDAAAFVAIVTPGYERSEWCRRELAAFISAAEKQGGIKLGTKTRFFKVLKMPVSLQHQPAPLRDILGYEFFVGEKEKEKEFEFLPDPKLAKQLYRAKLDDLAKEIHILLKELTHERADPHEDTTPPRNQKGVYLAWTTSDLQDRRDKIRRELLDRDFLVLPESDPPLQAESLTDIVRHALQQCQLSIHPLGGRFGIVPEGDTRSLPWLQHDLATERYKESGLQRILWMPQDIEVPDENQRQFLARIEREIGGISNGFQFLKTSLEELKTIVIEQLKVEAPKVLANDPASPRPTQIYLICERADRDVVQPLISYLRKRGYVVDLPDSSGDQADHRATLRECDSILVYHGSGSEPWLRATIRDCRKAFGWRRKKPFLSNGIYLGPQPNESKLKFETNEFVVCRSLETVSPEALDPFVATLSRSRTARQ